MRVSYQQLIGLNKRVSNYKGDRAKNLSLEALVNEDVHIIENLYKEEEALEHARLQQGYQEFKRTIDQKLGIQEEVSK